MEHITIILYVALFLSLLVLTPRASQVNVGIHIACVPAILMSFLLLVRLTLKLCGLADRRVVYKHPRRAGALMALRSEPSSKRRHSRSCIVFDSIHTDGTCGRRLGRSAYYWRYCIRESPHFDLWRDRKLLGCRNQRGVLDRTICWTRQVRRQGSSTARQFGASSLSSSILRLVRDFVLLGIPSRTEGSVRQGCRT